MSDDGVSRRDAWTAAHCVAFRELFAVCGRVGASRGDPRRVVLLTSLAGQFAWHGELLFDLLPVRVDVDRAALLESAARTFGSFADALADVGDDAALCAALASVVVPGLLGDVRAVTAVTDDRLDGPRVRALTLIERDLVAALDALRATVVSERAAAPSATGRLERAMEDLGALARARQGDLTPPVE